MTGPWYVDTNVVLRYLLNDHETHSPKARDFWESVRVGQATAILIEGVLMECVYFLTKYYKVPRTSAVSSLGGLLHYAGLVQEPQEIFTFDHGITKGLAQP